MRIICTVILLVALVFTGSAAAQTADEIVEKSLKALGGRAALGKITSRTITGKMTISTEGGDIPATFESVNQAPNKMRRLVTLDLSALGMPAATVEQRFDGTTAYVMESMRGESTLSGSQLENLKNSIFPSAFLDYKQRGTKVLLGGKEKLADRDVYALSVTPASGPVSRVFVDAESYLPVRAVVTLDTPETGPLEQTTDFSDFREVDGVKVPFAIKGTSAVQTFTITIAKVTHNAEIDPALFVRPPAK